MRKSTIIHLPADIKAAMPSFNENKQVLEIIQLALDGEFHDFKNKKFVCGKMQLAYMLESIPELKSIRETVKNGESDEAPDEEDKALMKKDWIDGGAVEEYNKFFMNNY